MSKPKKVLNLLQAHNPRYSKEGVEEQETAEYVYQVISFKNFLTLHIGQWLYPSQVDQAIESGIDVNITKGGK